MRNLRVWLLIGVWVTMLGPTMQAQNGQLFGGYSFERIAPGCGSNYRCGSPSDPGAGTNLSGWAASLAGYFHKPLGLEAQFTGDYNGSASISYSTISRYTFQFGPVFSFHAGKAKPFVHALFGGVKQVSSADQTLAYTRLLWTVGGGLDWKASSRFSIRLAQVDYERQSVPVVDTGGPTPFPPIGVNGLRYSAGVVVKF